MVDRTTLPVVSANEPLVVGQQFTIRGQHFGMWPSEIVLSFDEANVLTDQVPYFRLMRLVSKTETEMVFEVTQSHVFNSPHLWELFATGIEPPRVALTYYDA